MHEREEEEEGLYDEHGSIPGDLSPSSYRVFNIIRHYTLTMKEEGLYDEHIAAYQEI